MIKQTNIKNCPYHLWSLVLGLYLGTFWTEKQYLKRYFPDMILGHVLLTYPNNCWATGLRF